MSTREILTTGEFTGGPFNRLVRHPLARNDGSTLLVMDFGREDCNPHSGEIEIGDAFSNLEGSAGGVMSATGGSALPVTSSGGKLTAGTYISGNTQRLDIGVAGSFDLSDANPDFHAHLVFSLPDDAGSTTIQYTPIWAVGDGTNNLFRIDSGVNGRAPRANAAVVAGSPIYTGVTGFVLGAVNIVSVTRVGTLQQVWLNGVQAGSRTTNSALPDLSAISMSMFGGRAGESIWAAMLETIPEGRTAAQAVARAYAASNAAGYA